MTAEHPSMATPVSSTKFSNISYLPSRSTCRRIDTLVYQYNTRDQQPSYMHVSAPVIRVYYYVCDMPRMHVLDLRAL